MEHHPDPNTESAANSRPDLPAVHLQMVDNGNGTVHVEPRLIGDTDPWTALEMMVRAQVSMLELIKELDAQRKAETAKAKSRLIVPGRPLLRVN